MTHYGRTWLWLAAGSCLVWPSGSCFFSKEFSFGKPFA